MAFNRKRFRSYIKRTGVYCENMFCLREHNSQLKPENREQPFNRTTHITAKYSSNGANFLQFSRQLYALLREHFVNSVFINSIFLLL